MKTQTEARAKQEEDIEIMTAEENEVLEKVTGIVQKAKAKTNLTGAKSAFQLQELPLEQVRKGKKAIKALATKVLGSKNIKTTVKVSAATVKVSTVPVMKTFAEFVLQLREVLGQTQVELAKLLDVKQNSVSNWELSDTLPRRVVVARIKHVLKTRKLSNWIPVLDRVTNK